MRTKMTVVAALAAAAVAGSASASITFSFADPIPGRQLRNQANGAGVGVGLLTYDTTAPITFLVDGTDEGLSQWTWSNARMEMNLALGAATTFAGVTVAPVQGTFTIYDFTGSVRNDILTGTAAAGTFVRISNTNSILFSDPDFTYTAGPALAALLPSGVSFVNPTEGSFSVTDVSVAEGGGHFIGPGGVFRTFTANSSFSGNTALIPSPGALALAATSGMIALRRRRA